MKQSVAVIGIAVLVVVLAGCTAATKSTGPADQEYMVKAQSFESKGQLVEALEMYNLALTVNPDNPLAREKAAALQARLNELAEKHYQDGMSQYRKGLYAEARKEFLLALRYNPDHAEANAMVSEQDAVIGAKRYIRHVVQADESLSLLAKRYYGDYHKFHLIARFNRLDDATKITVGQVIKVPVVDGVPFFAGPGEIVRDGEKPTAITAEGIITTERSVTHAIRPGESLSQLAEQYYGDQMYFNVIASYNGLDDPTNIRVGQEIKIPEIRGVPFLVEEEQIEAVEETAPVEAVEAVTAPPEEPSPVLEPPQEPTPATVPAEEAKPAPVPPQEPTLATVPAEEAKPVTVPAEETKPVTVPEQPEPVAEPLKTEQPSPPSEPIAAYREQGIEFYKNRNYTDAIQEFQKVLSVNPGDRVAKRYMGFAHYGQGMKFYQKQEYLQAIASLKAALEYDSDCAECRAYIEKSKEAFKDLFYRRGLDYFKQEKLTDAIRQWEVVYDMDPAYRDVESNLQKARQLQQRLEEIKSTQEPAGN